MAKRKSKSYLAIFGSPWRVMRDPDLDVDDSQDIFLIIFLTLPLSMPTSCSNRWHSAKEGPPWGRRYSGKHSSDTLSLRQVLILLHPAPQPPVCLNTVQRMQLRGGKLVCGVRPTARPIAKLLFSVEAVMFPLSCPKKELLQRVPSAAVGHPPHYPPLTMPHLSPLLYLPRDISS